MTTEFGQNLEGVLDYHQIKVSGILNGIDVKKRDPLNISPPYKPFDQSSLDIKLSNKEIWLKREGRRPKRPLIAIISRLTEQKGLPFMFATCDWVAEYKEAYLVVLGSTHDESVRERFESYNT